MPRPSAVSRLLTDLEQLIATLQSEASLHGLLAQLPGFLDRLFGVPSSAVVLLHSAEPEVRSIAASRTPPAPDLHAIAAWARIYTLAPRERTAFSSLARPAPTGLDDQLAAPVAAGLFAPVWSSFGLSGVIYLAGEGRMSDWELEEKCALQLLARHVGTLVERIDAQQVASHDDLTGICSRRAILEHLDRELKRAVRHQRSLCVGMVDLDRLKEINDRLGHLEGDQVLRRVAAAISSDLRSSDRVGRYGGDEFLLVLPETDQAGGLALGRKICAKVAEEEIPTPAGSPPLSVSIGLVAFALPLLRAPRSNDIVAEVDRVLYRVKRAGGGDVASLVWPA